ncbi:MAG TPA: 50S ribosomal protein L13 [Nitrospirota bacterium]|nr:50S ribosomal protein L13 [Nitrospirota bacterium]
MSTVSAKKEDVERKWFLVDANNVVLGRLAAKVASVLKGKHKAIYTPHVDTGDFIIIVNAEKVQLTGNKLEDKQYFHHSGYPGGLKCITAGKLLKTKPGEVIQSAVRGMLPKNPLGRDMILKMKVYAGPDHPHAAQKPEILKIEA